VSPAQGGAPPGEEGATTRRRPAATALSAAVLAALVVATFLAIFFAQELKRRPALLLAPIGTGTIAFQPVGAITLPGVHHYAHLSVRTTVSDQLTLSIVSERSGVTERTFSLRLRKYRRKYLAWTGATVTGALAPPGDYRLVVHFATGGQTVRPLLTLRLLGPRG
jgi:hypothetical protein